MGELEKLIKERIDESMARLIAEFTCECGMMMMPHSLLIGTLWCPLCGRMKDAPEP